MNAESVCSMYCSVLQQCLLYTDLLFVTGTRVNHMLDCHAFLHCCLLCVYTTGAAAAAGALAVIDVHARDVVEKMAAGGVSNASDFDWYSQMRFYWKKPTAGTASTAAAVTTALNRSAGNLVASVSDEQ
jgi:hypothetical protein